MRLKMNTKLVLRILYILSWIIFVGLSIEAGGSIVGAIFAFAKPEMVKKLYLWQQADFSGLFAYDHGYFILITSFMSFVTTVKAILFYLIIRIIHNKKVNMSQPFNKELGGFIFNISYLALFIGVFSGWGAKYVEWLTTQGVQMPDIQSLHLGGAEVWLFMGVTLLVVAYIFKRGIEIQSENELTI